jgi:uncharacterized protein involved in exopolysaccharide biosynthesis
MNTQLRTDYQRPPQLRDRVDSDEADAREQLTLLWRAKWLIAAVTLAFGVLTTGAAFLMPKQYEATIMLSPLSMKGGGQMGSLGGMASELGGIAALAGVSLGGDTGKAEAVAVLQSESLTEAYIRQNGLLTVLYRNDWDATRNVWKNTNPKKMPTVWKASRKFDKSIRRVLTMPKTGLVTMTITWEDPKLAAAWANGLVRMTNDELRDKAIRESERNIDYLNAEAAKSNVVEVRQAIYSIMKTEINRAMIARGSDEYAFKIVDPATPPELASSPIKALWLLGGLAGGFMLSVAVVFARASWKRPR